MSDLSEFVVLSDTTLTTDSRRVAKHFRKRHDHVLRAIDNLPCSQEFRAANFGETVESRENPSGGAPISSRVIQMTKDGFAILAMGFTGKDAMVFKEMFIKAFNAMADQLQRIGDSRAESLWAQRLDLEKREATSFMWASFGAKRMQERRMEKPLLQNEREILLSSMEPSLFDPLTPINIPLQ